MNKFIKSAGTICFMVSIFLSGCSTNIESKNIVFSQDYIQTSQQKAKRVHTLALNGKIAILADNRISGNYSYSKEYDDLKLEIISPFGSSIAKLKASKSFASLVANSRTYEASNPNALIESLIGYSIPIDALNKIFLALPDKALLLDKNGLIKVAICEGFKVTYSNYKDYNGIAMPNDILIEGNGIKVKIKIAEVIKLLYV